MKLFVRLDRCNARKQGRQRSVRVVGADEPTAYGSRRLYRGLKVRVGRQRLRIYLLGPARSSPVIGYQAGGKVYHPSDVTIVRAR